MAVKEYGEQVIFLRQIVPGGTDKSYGIHVAKLAGLPKEVVERANEILDNLECNAIAEAGQPALSVKRARESSKRYKAQGQAPEGPLQPSLFDL